MLRATFRRSRRGAIGTDGPGIPVGEPQSMTLDLETGNYVLSCNMYDTDEMEAHCQEGMRLTFTVT
jgi:hypothetical protein